MHIDQRLSNRGPRIFFATVGMAIVVESGERAFLDLCNGPCDALIPFVVLLVIGGLVVYGALAQAIGAARWQEFNFWRERKKQTPDALDRS